MNPDLNPNPSSNPNTKLYVAIIILVILLAGGGLFMFYKISQNGTNTTELPDQTGDTATPAGATTAEEDLSKDVLSDINYDLKAGI